MWGSFDAGQEPQALRYCTIYTKGVTQDFGQLSKSDPTQGRSVIVLINSVAQPQHMNVPKDFGYVCGGYGSHLMLVWSLTHCIMGVPL
jgi:hypothetical protein